MSDSTDLAKAIADDRYILVPEWVLSMPVCWFEAVYECYGTHAIGRTWGNA